MSRVWSGSTSRRQRGFSTVDFTYGMSSILGGIVVWGAELDTSVKITAVLAWVLASVWWAVAMKISNGIDRLRNELIENHIMDMKSDIAEIKMWIESSPWHKKNNDSKILRP